MRFVPRPTSDPSVLPHRHLGGDPRVHGLELLEGTFDEADAVDCPLALGGVTVHHCRTVHGTAATAGASARDALIVNFAAPEHPLPEPRDFPWQRATDNARDRERRRRGIELP